MATVKDVVNELTKKGIDADLLKETLLKNRKKIEKITDEADLQVTLYRLLAPVFGAGEARDVAKKIVPFLPEILGSKDDHVNEHQVAERSQSIIYTLNRTQETVLDYLPRSFHQEVVRLASQPAITYLELNEYFFNISDRSLEALVKESSLDQLFQWTTKRLLSWPKLYGEDEYDIYLFYFADFEEKPVMFSDDVVFLPTEVWNNIGITVEWPIHPKQLRGLNATSTILALINTIFRNLAGIFEWKRLFSKIDKDAIMLAEIPDLFNFFVGLLQGKLNLLLNPKNENGSFSIKLETVHDFQYELGFRPESFIKTKNPNLQSFGLQLMNLMFHWKLFRWMGFRDESHASSAKESFFDLFLLACKEYLQWQDISTPTELPSLEESYQRCQELHPDSGIMKALIEPIAKELSYLVKIVTLKGGINQDLTMGFRNGYLATRIGKTLHQIHALYQEWQGERLGTESFLHYIYRVAAEGLASSDNMVLKKSLQYLMAIDEEKFGRRKDHFVKSDMVQSLLEQHQVIHIEPLEDSESTQQWIKSTILQVHSFIHGARLFKMLREGFKRFEERPLREIWGEEEQKEMFTEMHTIITRSPEASTAMQSIKHLVIRALQEGFNTISLPEEIEAHFLNELPWHEDLTNREKVVDFLNTLTELLHRDVNPLLGRSQDVQEERISFTDELEQAVTVQHLIQRMYREHAGQFRDAARSKSRWLYYQNERMMKELEPLMIGGLIHLTLQKRLLKGNANHSQTFEDLFTLLEGELAALSQTQVFQSKEESDQLRLIKEYIINTVELWSNAFRLTDLINTFMQSQDFLQSFNVKLEEKSTILQKPEIRSFIAQHYIRNWITAWFNSGLDLAEAMVESANLTEEEEENQIWNVLEATKRIHFPQFLRWMMVGNTSHRLEFIDSLVDNYLKITDPVIQADFVAVYPEMTMALLVLLDEGATNLKQVELMFQHAEINCDIHYLRGGEIHSVMSSLTSRETPFPRDILKNVAALSILHGLELEAITFKFPRTSFYLTMAYHPRINIYTDVVGTTSIIITKTVPLSEQVADAAPENAEILSGLHTLFSDDSPENPIMKLVMLQRLRYTALIATQSLDFMKSLKIPSDLNTYEEATRNEATLGRNYEVWGLFRAKLGKKTSEYPDKAKVYVKSVQFFGQKLAHFAYINQFLIAFLPLSHATLHSLEMSKTLESPMYRARHQSIILSPVTAIFRSKDVEDTVRKVVVLYDNPMDETIDVCVLWENDDVLEPYSINKTRFMLNSNRNRTTNEWNLEELAVKTFNFPVNTPSFDVTKQDPMSGEPLPETDLEKIESISQGGF